MRRREWVAAFVVGAAPSAYLAMTGYGNDTLGGRAIQLFYGYWYLGVAAVIAGSALAWRGVGGLLSRLLAIVGWAWLGFLVGSIAITMTLALFVTRGH